MDAIHVNWTKPFVNKTGKRYETEDFELLTTILSALKWREKNGRIKMITDTAGEEYYESIGLACIWDGIETRLDDVDVNPGVFWAAGKLFALKNETAPVAMIDTDFILWETLDENDLSDVTVIHFEELAPHIYPPREYFKMRDYVFDSEFDWTLKACNTALCVIKNDRFLKYYTKQSIDFMRHTDEEKDYLRYMVFAEQRLIHMCAKKMGMSVSAFSDMRALFEGREARFTHTWGMKQQMRDNDALRFDFCKRCVRRILTEYPHMEEIMRNIPCLMRYF